MVRKDLLDALLHAREALEVANELPPGTWNRYGMVIKAVNAHDQARDAARGHRETVIAYNTHIRRKK